MTPKVLVVGGGYAGVLAAIRLGNQGLDTTLVDPKPTFVEKVRLHQVAAGQTLPERKYTDILGDAAAFIQGRAVRIDRDAHAVVLEDGTILPYDRLLLAAGSEPGRVPAGALPIADPESARRIAVEIESLPAGKRVAVIGTGLSGVETATEIAEGRADLQVLLIGPDPANLLGSGGAAIHRALERLGIEHVDGMAEMKDGLITVEGRPVLADLIIWAAALQPARWLGSLGLQTTEDGAILVDEHLRSSDSAIYVAGDAAAVVVRGHRARMACASAMPMGAHASTAITADLRGQDIPRFKFGWIATCVSLGRSDAVFVQTDRDDQPIRFVRGPLAALGKEMICRYTVGMFHAERVGLHYQWRREA